VPPDHRKGDVLVRGVPNTSRDRVISWSFWALLVGFPSVVLLLSAHLPDEQDRLSARERAIAGPVLDEAPICANAFGRVTEVELDDHPGQARSFRYRCEWTVLGIAARTHTASCVGGAWEFSGWRDPWHAGEC
jgi:hypothetical protein